MPNSRAFNSLFEMQSFVEVEDPREAQLSILYLRCRACFRRDAWRRILRLSILYLRCVVYLPRGGVELGEVPFNSLFEMLCLDGGRPNDDKSLRAFNSLFEMP